MELLIVIVVVFLFILFGSAVLANQKKQLARTEQVEEKLNEVLDLLNPKN